ncbi:hypothetical protein VP01_3230g2 [Puccinia sorghi]|uniref:Uncharacterized protein n=1 Tax=Puccinia sorghi TaxID=27349 RepID=A0A0L6UY58_9BASI|nr:hypothetical protein VP01_3230g2 [Puccinia sorghi]
MNCTTSDSMLRPSHCQKAPETRGLESGVYTYNLLNNTPLNHYLVRIRHSHMISWSDQAGNGCFGPKSCSIYGWRSTWDGSDHWIGPTAMDWILAGGGWGLWIDGGAGLSSGWTVDGIKGGIEDDESTLWQEQKQKENMGSWTCRCVSSVQDIFWERQYAFPPPVRTGRASDKETLKKHTVLPQKTLQNPTHIACNPGQKQQKKIAIPRHGWLRKIASMHWLPDPRVSLCMYPASANKLYIAISPMTRVRYRFASVSLQVWMPLPGGHPITRITWESIRVRHSCVPRPSGLRTTSLLEFAGHGHAKLQSTSGSYVYRVISLLTATDYQERHKRALQALQTVDHDETKILTKSESTVFFLFFLHLADLKTRVYMNRWERDGEVVEGPEEERSG